MWLRNPWLFAALAGSALLYVTFLISGLAEDVLDGEKIVAIDGWLVRWLAGHRTPLGIAVFKCITAAGAWQVVLVVFAVVALAAAVWKPYRRTALALAMACAGSELVVFFGKIGFGRPRPPAVLSVVTSLDAGFPSGHASVSVALYALCFYLLSRMARSKRVKALCMSLAGLFPLLIGFSRLYLGAHYLSDVLAGWGVGTWWSILVLGLAGFLRRRKATHGH